MGSSTGLSLLLLLALHCADGQRYGSYGHYGYRAGPGTTCWYPEYYCSVTAGNVQSKTVVTGGAQECYNDCKADGSCQFFTWFKRRGVEYCYFLTECGEDYHVKDDYCSLHESCYSGPKDCASISPDNALCAKLDAASDKIEWQCEDGGTGLYVNGYNGTIDAGARCMLSCASWQSFRWDRDDKSIVKYPNKQKAFLFSTCQADGTWSDVLPNDFKDGQTGLEWPAPSNLGLPTYPTPDVGSLSCGCSDLVLVWPALDVGSGKKFYYNPRQEEGASMECHNEVQNSLVESTGEFRIDTDNTCEFLCDDILVATISCVDGKWTGEKDQGFWCYQHPQQENMLKQYAVRMIPSNGSMSSTKGGDIVDKCIMPSTSGICSTEKNSDIYPWISIELDCPAEIRAIKYKFDDVGWKNMINMTMYITNTVPTTADSPFEDGQKVAEYEGPPSAGDTLWKESLANKQFLPGKIVVFQTDRRTRPVNGRMAAKWIKIYGTCATDFAQRWNVNVNLNNVNINFG